MTAVFVMLTPVITDIVALISPKVFTPKSAEVGLGVVVGVTTTADGSVNTCVFEPNRSNDRKKRSESTPLSEATTAPTADSS